MHTFRSLQGMRFAFISLIVFSHIIPGFDFGGDSGVAFFFMLSGFVLSYAYEKKSGNDNFSTKALLLHQLQKVYPPYCAMLIVFILLNMLTGIENNYAIVLVDMLMLQSWFPNNGITFAMNGPAWFISSIMFCYVIFLPVYSFLSSRRYKQIIVAIIAVLTAYCVINAFIPDNKVNDIIYVNPALRSIDFMIGIIVYNVFKSRIVTAFTAFFSKKKYRPLLAESILWLLYCMLFWCYIHTPARIHCAALFWPFMAVAIFMTTLLERCDIRHTLTTKFLSSRLLVDLGNLSMEIFITHALVIRIINAIIRRTEFKFVDYSFIGIVEFVIIIIFAFLMKKINSFLMNKIQLIKKL